MPAPADSPDVLERFHAHLDLVERVARQLRRSLGDGVEPDELLASGREGLLDAARRFEPDRGVPFGAYATLRVRGSMLDGVRRLTALPRRTYNQLRALEAGLRVSEGAAEDVFGARPRGEGPPEAEAALQDHLASMATAMAVGLLAPADASTEDVPAGLSPEDAVAERELLERVRAAAEELPEPESTLVRRHYFGGERFDHVAAELGLSKSWASRLHTRAIKRLTRRLGSTT